MEAATSLSDAEETSTIHQESSSSSSSSSTTTATTTEIPPPTSSKNVHKPYFNPPLASPDNHNFMSAPTSPIIPRRTLSAGSGALGRPTNVSTVAGVLGPQKPPMLSRRRSSYAMNMMDNLMRFESRKSSTSVSNLLMIHQQNEAQQQHNQQLQQEQDSGKATFELMEPRERLRQRFISKSQESLSLPSSPTISHSSSSTSIGLGVVPSLDPTVASKISVTNADTASIISQESVSTTSTAVATTTTNLESQETDDEQMYRDLKAIVEFLENSGGSLLEDWSHNANYVDLHNLSLSNVNQFSQTTNLKINLLEALATPFTDKPTQTTTTTTTVASGSTSTATPGSVLNVSNNRMIGGLTLSRASPSVIGLNQLNSSSSASSSSSSVTTSTPTTVTTTTTTTSTANTTGRQYHMGSAGKNMQPKAIFTCELESPWDLKNANDVALLTFGFSRNTIRALTLLDLIAPRSRQLVLDRLFGGSELIFSGEIIAIKRMMSSSGGGQMAWTSLWAKRKEDFMILIFQEVPCDAVDLVISRTIGGSGSAVNNNAENGANGERNNTLGDKAAHNDTNSDTAIDDDSDDSGWSVESFVGSTTASSLFKEANFKGLKVSQFLPTMAAKLSSNIKNSNLIDPAMAPSDLITKTRYFTMKLGKHSLLAPCAVTSDELDSSPSNDKQIIRLHLHSLPYMAGTFIISSLDDYPIIGFNQAIARNLFGTSKLNGVCIDKILPRFSELMKLAQLENPNLKSELGLVLPEHYFRKLNAALLAKDKAIANASSDVDFDVDQEAELLFLNSVGLDAIHSDGATIKIDVQLRVLPDDSFMLWMTYSRACRSGPTSSDSDAIKLDSISQQLNKIKHDRNTAAAKSNSGVVPVSHSHSQLPSQLKLMDEAGFQAHSPGGGNSAGSSVDDLPASAGDNSNRDKQVGVSGGSGSVLSSAGTTITVTTASTSSSTMADQSSPTNDIDPDLALREKYNILNPPSPEKMVVLEKDGNRDRSSSLFSMESQEYENVLRPTSNPTSSGANCGNVSGVSTIKATTSSSSSSSSTSTATVGSNNLNNNSSDSDNKFQQFKLHKMTSGKRQLKRETEQVRYLQQTSKFWPPQVGTHRRTKKFTDFKVIKNLGHGAYGNVVIGQHVDDPPYIVCIKAIFKERILVDTWVRDRSLGTIPSEIQILNSINMDPHPNIQRIVDFFEDENCYYLETMQHGGGVYAIPDSSTSTSESSVAATPTTNQAFDKLPPPLSTAPPAVDLFDLIELKQDTMTEMECKYIYYQICSAMAHLHAHGVVHRDIKDENIIVDQDFIVKLIDFGSAAYSKNGPFGVFVGTIDYAAPEVLNGKPYEGKAQDVWAMGVLLYTLVFKENPFVSVDEILDGGFVIPDSHGGDGVSDECIELIKLILVKDVLKRPTMKQILEHEWLKGMK
ncbi:unnamed protein product [Ambrosiozyma monospora]|uniref:non-specific serine/threonine protein kinase n=1 Tax=Ambrosiozyma monospora TaxID=43982 RepID=A0A9W6YWE5_AMBMO|nr:unnamed protein product [Ambrosiozyma monospora]